MSQLVTAYVLAITRVDIADYVSNLIFVYTIIVFISVLLTWLPQMPENPVFAGLVRFVRDVTDPYLRIFRRVIPPISIGGGAMDLSPIAGLILLYVAQRVIPPLIAG